MTPARPYNSPRRAQDAAGTRRDILRAAKDLFIANGYARVTVAGIAREAGVAVQTVYASTGGKSDIFTEILSEAISGAGAPETLEILRRTEDLPSALRVVAHGTRLGNESNQDTMNILYAAISVHEDAERFWEQATGRYRAALREAAVHLAETGFLAESLPLDKAADILWFCFGASAWRTLVEDCGWTWDDAESWLAAQAVLMLG